MIDRTPDTGSFGSSVSRRDFVRASAIGALGLTLPGLLQENARATAGWVQRAGRAKSVLLVFLGGGLSQLDTFDVKPHAPSDIRGKYSSIPTHVTGLRVGERLPRMARTMDKVCLVRSQSHDSTCHQTATNWMLSGRRGSPFGDHPSVGSVVTHRLGVAGNIPPYVAIPRNPTFMWELGKSAALGDRCESFAAGNLNRLSSTAREAFDIDAERPALRDRYGRSEFGQGCLLARRLVERGVRFTQVNFVGWDHHARIWDSLDKRLPEFDAGFSTLIQDMYDRGLLEQTLVVCMSEFGRTPRVNADGGRDHWAQAGSMLFAGAGVQGGSVVGATDKHGKFVTDRPVRPADVAWTIYDALGIDPRTDLRTPDGPSVAILDHGTRISEIYA